MIKQDPGQEEESPDGGQHSNNSTGTRNDESPPGARSSSPSLRTRSTTRLSGFQVAETSPPDEDIITPPILPHHLLQMSLRFPGAPQWFLEGQLEREARHEEPQWSVCIGDYEAQSTDGEEEEVDFKEEEADFEQGRALRAKNETMNPNNFKVETKGVRLIEEKEEKSKKMET